MKVEACVPTPGECFVQLSKGLMTPAAEEFVEYYFNLLKNPVDGQDAPGKLDQADPMEHEPIK